MRNTVSRVATVLAIGILLLAWPVSLTSADSDEPFSLQECETDCRWTFGGSEWSPPALKSSQAIGYNNCILACQRKHWKRFDQETEGSAN